MLAVFKAKMIILEEFTELMRVQKPWGNWGKIMRFWMVQYDCENNKKERL